MATKLVEHTEEIVAAYVLEGKSLRAIADTYGVSSGSVRSALKKSGTVLRPRGRKAGKLNEDVPASLRDVQVEDVRESDGTFDSVAGE